MATPFSSDTFGASISSADATRIGVHKAQLRRAFIQAAGDLVQGDWQPDDDAALDAATTWLANLIRRRYAQPRSNR